MRPGQGDLCALGEADRRAYLGGDEIGHLGATVPVDLGESAYRVDARGRVGSRPRSGVGGPACGGDRRVHVDGAAAATRATRDSVWGAIA